MSNYYKYYHLRASPMTQLENGSNLLGNSQQQQKQPTGISSANKLSASKIHANHHRQSSIKSPSFIQTDSSPWRGTSLPPGQQVVTQKPIVCTSAFVNQSEKSLQQFALEKQNENLRQDKIELENQISKLKIYYQKQSTLDQQDLMLAQRDKASLQDELREQQEIVSILKDKYEKEAALLQQGINNPEKNANRKQTQLRSEWEGKLERLTTYYTEQLQLKQEEIQRSKNKLNLQEITTADISAKLKIFEQTNRDLRAKWDEDIKNFGIELENQNKLLLKERYRNEELERSLKMSKLGQFQNLENKNSYEIYKKEIEQLSRENADLLQKLSEQEKKQRTLEMNLKENRQFDSSSSNASAIQLLRQKFESQVEQNEHLLLDIQRQQSEFQILKLENSSLHERQTQIDQNQREKDLLVQQMLSHIEQIEKENQELQLQFEKVIQEIPNSQLSAHRQFKFSDLLNEIKTISLRNQQLEEQLVESKQGLFNSHSQNQINNLELRLSHLQSQLVQINKSIPKQTPLSQANDIQKQVDEMSLEVKENQKKLSEGAKQTINPQFKFNEEFTSIKQSSDNNPKQNNRSSNISPLNTIQAISSVHQNSTSKTQSEIKMPTVLESQINDQDKKNSSHQLDLNSEKQKEIESRFKSIEDKTVNMQQNQLENTQLQQISKSQSQQINRTIINLHPFRLDSELIVLDILKVLNCTQNTHQFDKNLEGREIFDTVIGFVGCSDCGKTTLINSIIKEAWDESKPTTSSSQKMQIKRYSCMQKQVALLESDLIIDEQFMRFVCNFSQALVLFFKSWSHNDQQIYSKYANLLKTEVDFASELIIIHSDSQNLDIDQLNHISNNLTKLQEGLFRGKLDGKFKKINVYHVLLHPHSDKLKSQSIFDEIIAVCRGTIIGKLASSKGKLDLFKKLNQSLVHS